MSHRRFGIAFALLAGIGAFLPAGGQQASPPAATATATNAPEMSTHDAPATFTTGVNLVMVPVVVRDGQGHAIGTLHQDDFLLFDKGKPQLITKFSIEKPGAPAIPAATATQVTENGEAQGPAAAAPPIPERFVAYLFDDIHLQTGDLIQARLAAIKHLEGLETITRAAVFTTSGRTTVDFTDDRPKLREAIERIQPWISALSNGSQCPPVTYYMADLIRNKNDAQSLGAATQDAIACLGLDPTQASSAQIAQAAANAAASQELNVGDNETQVSLSVLKDVVRRMAATPGTRNLVLVSPGFFLTLDHRPAETDIMDRAIRANVTINSINARGLYNPSIEVDASQRTPSINSLNLWSQMSRDSALADEDTMAELASATGGTYFHNNNDLLEGFKTVSAQPEFIYLLGFSPQNLRYDGTYHTLKVTLKVSRGTSLQARRGYYAPKHAVDPEETSKEEIQEAMFSRDEMVEIPVELNLQFFKSSEANARLSVMARVDLKGLHFRKAEDRNLDKLTIISGVFDRNGNFISGIQKTIDMKLKDDTLLKLPPSGINVRTNFDLAPGTYAVRLVVRDSEGQFMAARNGSVQIP